MPRPQGTNMPKSGYFLCKYLNIARRNPVPLSWGQPPGGQNKTKTKKKADILAVTIKKTLYTGAGPNDPANPCPFCSRRE